jgi:hypothetical protein
MKLMEEHGLRTFRREVLMIIFGIRRDEITGCWRNPPMRSKICCSSNQVLLEGSNKRG